MVDLFTGIPDELIESTLQTIRENLDKVGLFGGHTEYSCAATPQIRQTGNRLSGLAETVYASLLAQCFV